MSWVETVKVTLTKPWGPHAAGKTIEVDPDRAGALDEGGYLKRPDEPAERPKRRGRG